MNRERRLKRSADGHRGHPDRERLIDLVDGGLEAPEVQALNEHLVSCAGCRSYLDSLKATLELVGADVVPEQPAAYWGSFEAEVRRRVRSQSPADRSLLGSKLGTGPGRRWRLALVLSPGLAVALAFVLSLALTGNGGRVGPGVPGYIVSDVLPDAASDLEPPLDDMTVGEIARSMSEDAVFADMVIEAAEDDISLIEQYLLETEDIGALIDGLADDEAQNLAATLAGRMNRPDTRLMPEDQRERT